MLAFFIYLLFTVSYFLHMTSRAAFLGTIRFDLILMIILFVFMIASTAEILKRYRQSPVCKRLIFFICYFMLTIPLVKWPGSVINYGLEYYLKAVFFFFFTLAFVNTEKRLKIFLLVFIGCQIFRGLEPAWMHYSVGYWGDIAYSHIGGKLDFLNRLSGAPHDIVNPNQLAWVIVSTVPFLIFIGWQGGGFLSKLLCLILAAGLLYAMMLTGSRSGLISLFSVFLGVVFFSKKRLRNLLLLLLVIAPLTILISGMLSPKMAERYRSIYDSAAVGADTAQGRIRGLENNFTTLMTPYALFGYGLGTSREVNSNYLGSAQPAHDLYIETLQEVGIIGFFLFAQYVFIIFKSLYITLHNAPDEEHNFLFLLIKSLLVWVWMDLIYSLSCFGLSSWEWYLFGGLTTVSLHLYQLKTNTRQEIQIEPTKE